MVHNLSGGDENLSPSARQEIKKITEDEAIMAQWRKEMMASEVVREYLDKYDADSVNSFLDNYLNQKLSWVKYGDMYAKMKEEEELQFENEAYQYLEMIQQKKLFNLQCEWRAEKVELEDIVLTYDLFAWGDDILNCTLIEPINEDDIAFCQHYLYTGNLYDEDAEIDPDWQDYDSIKEGYQTDNREGYYPAWYEFCDEQKGTGVYLLMPDIRGEKEAFYRGLYFDERDAKEQVAEELARQPAINNKPSLSTYDDKVMEYLIHKFESKQLQQQYKACKWGISDSYEEERMQVLFKLLSKAEEPVPIEANSNWLEALELAVAKYKRKKVAEALPGVWEQYMMNVEMGIAFHVDRASIHKQLRDIVGKQILTGRRLNGEPEDFNF
jgi:hypothetical protein